MNASPPLAGRVALVTGAGRGTGHELEETATAVVVNPAGMIGGNAYASTKAAPKPTPSTSPLRSSAPG